MFCAVCVDECSALLSYWSCEMLCLRLPSTNVTSLIPYHFCSYLHLHIHTHTLILSHLHLHPSMFCIASKFMMSLFDIFKVNINRNGHWNRLHTHAGASWSGVYYIKSLKDSLLREYRYLLGHCTLHMIHLAFRQHTDALGIDPV